MTSVLRFMTFVLLISATVASNEVDISSCFITESTLAGSTSGTLINDLTLLKEMMEYDYRMWGFQICGAKSGSFSSFRIKLASDYGVGDFVDLNPIGPGTDNCGRYKLSDAVNEPI